MLMKLRMCETVKRPVCDRDISEASVTIQAP